MTGIREMAQEHLPITLALSLHAPNDELRAQLIPTARKWKLDEPDGFYGRRRAGYPCAGTGAFADYSRSVASRDQRRVARSTDSHSRQV